MLDQRLFIFRLKHLKGIGNKGLLLILQYKVENPEEELTAEKMSIIGRVRSSYQETFSQSFEKVQQISQENLLDFLDKYSFVTIMDDEYPENLREIYNPPIALFYLGNIRLMSSEKLAIIGSRNATPYGKEMIEKIVPDLCEKEITIVSGLARGNDTSAHQAAIRHQGQTIAVIGSGLDYVYPKENWRLQQYIGEKHLLLTEYLPKTLPLAYHFPSRNRIIAGLSQGVCVIEAEKKSGTFITAQLALEEGRDVFAVPGNPLKDHSEGCLQLIQEGAKCTWKASDILNEFS